MGTALRVSALLSGANRVACGLSGSRISLTPAKSQVRPDNLRAVPTHAPETSRLPVVSWTFRGTDEGHRCHGLVTEAMPGPAAVLTHIPGSISFRAGVCWDSAPDGECKGPRLPRDTQSLARQGSHPSTPCLPWDCLTPEAVACSFPARAGPAGHAGPPHAQDHSTFPQAPEPVVQMLY